MAIELADAADIAITHRMATLLLKLRLYRPLYRRLTRVGRLDIPASHTQVLRSVITVPILHQAGQGNGTIFTVHDSAGEGLDLTVREDAAGSFSFTGNWAAIFRNFNISRNAVLSLWFFLDHGGIPNLVLRPDGYRKPFQPVPPLPEGLGHQPGGVNTPVFKGTANGFINFVTSSL